MTEREPPRGGALRYRNDDGEWVMANPRDPLYSSVTMSATQYFEDGQWKEIWPTDEE